MALFPGFCSECDPDACEVDITPLPTESPTASPIAIPSSPGAHCGCEGCNLDAWHAPAAEATCGGRIEFLVFGGMPEREACELVADVQFVDECGACNPNKCPIRSTPRCGCEACEVVWDVVADEHTCGARITWLQTSKFLEDLYSEDEACAKVGVEEFSDVCGACACSGSAPVPTPMPTSLPVPDPTPIPTASPTLAPTASPTDPMVTSAPTSNPFDFSSIIEKDGGMATLLPPKHIDESIVYNRAIPTSKWWTNMIVADPFFPDSNVNFPVFTHPYRLTFNNYPDREYGLHVCHQSDYRIFLENSENGVPKGYTHGSGSDFIFGAVEFSAVPQWSIVDFDDYGFGVTVEVAEANGDGLIATDLVAGMPFITARYQSLTPKLYSVHQILTVNGETVVPGSSSFSGTRFIVTNNKGQTWAIYSSNDVTLNANGKSLESTESFDDITLRIAIIPGEEADSIYDPYWTCIVTGATLEIYDDSAYGIDWNTKGDCSRGLLHLGFPHHDQVLDKQTVADVGFSLRSATRGDMKAFATSDSSTLWTLNEVDDIPVDGFFAPRDPNQELIDFYDVGEVLKEEIFDGSFLLNGGSYYFTGKEAQKYASMCLLATNPSVNSDASLAETCLNRLKDSFDAFLRNAFTYPLVYDEVYRGIITSEGIVRNDVNADFGNSGYNDHPLHYGYWIFAGAALKTLDPKWDRMPELNVMITSLIRDTANGDSATDPDFPLYRHFDWFAGHSLAHGLVPFFDGKDQESTSEAMNFYYSLYLWGRASNDSDLETRGRLMMKVGKRSMGQYLLMEDSNTVHEQIVPNKVVGIFFENKVDYTTWFGNNREYMHGIQMIPVSPINEFSRTDTFVREEWEAVLSSLDLVANPEDYRNNAWQSLLFSNFAVIDKGEAMNQLSKSTMDGGLSRAWALYFAASRP
ncbi:MAG: hypothetical protein SGILL_003921 [Bacillariaceae sp.]